MKNKSFRKCLTMLGLFLFLAVIGPVAVFPATVAQASTPGSDKDKNDYRLNLKSITLVKGKTFTLKAYNLNEKAKINFKSDDQEIASVSEDGLITANKVGNTIITATIKDGSGSTSLACDVTVGPPAVSIKWTQSRIILGIDNVDTLRVILKPSNTAEDARFSSFDPSLVSISTGGRVTARDYGMTFVFAGIDATDSDGMPKYATCSVIVTSQENAPLLEKYFNDHPELDLIPQESFTISLLKFFNSGSNNSESKSLVDSLKRYLNEEYDLEAYRKAWEEREAALSKLSLDSVEVISGSAVY
jgi:hypothetical protein